MNVTHANEDIVVEIAGMKIVLTREESIELAQLLLDIAGKVYGD